MAVATAGDSLYPSAGAEACVSNTARPTINGGDSPGARSTSWTSSAQRPTGSRWQTTGCGSPFRPSALSRGAKEPSKAPGSTHSRPHLAATNGRSVRGLTALKRMACCKKRPLESASQIGRIVRPRPQALHAQGLTAFARATSTGRQARIVTSHVTRKKRLERREEEKKK
jgi:hypothetical protein